MNTVIVTGASGGIGGACAKAFWEAGYNVVAVYNKTNNLCIPIEDERVLAIKADVSKENDIINLFQTAKDKFGTIDSVVNCAGVSSFGLVQDVDETELNRLLDINVKGCFFMCKHAARYMIPCQSGSIINISSVWGETGASCEVLYSMTKSAINGLTKALAKELGPSGIRVNCVTPGFIDTAMNNHLDAEAVEAFCMDTPLMRVGTPEEVARAVLFLAGDSSSFITGQILGVNGGYHI